MAPMVIPELLAIIGQLTQEEQRALVNPLWLDKGGEPQPGNTGAETKAFIAPMGTQSGGKPALALPNRPVPLSQAQVQQAEDATSALLRLNRLLTGHPALSLITFPEGVIVSGGILPFAADGRFVGMYKKQPQIGRGASAYRIGRAGRFVLPHTRPESFALPSIAKAMEEMGLPLTADRLNPYGPDVTIVKPNYDMTHRNNNFGVVFSYLVYLNEQDWVAMRNRADGKPILVLEGNDPHPADDEIAQYGVVLRLMTQDDLLRLEDEGRLTLEAELPKLLELFDDRMNFG